MTIVLRAGAVSLSDWRAIWRGADLVLDPAHAPAVAASAAAVTRILAKGEPVYGINTGFGRLAGVRIAEADLARLQRNIVLSHAVGVGEASPESVVRLMMALKLASLAQGASGVRPETLALLQAMLARGVTPIVPSQGSVGASGDLAPLAYVAAAMIGIGEAISAGAKLPAAEALARVGLAPIELGPKEGLALLNGTQFSTANALAGLFEIETVFQSALVTGALSTDAARGSDTPFDRRIHALRRHRGQIEVASTLRALMAGSLIRASHLKGDARVQDAYCLRCQPQVMGACLDLMRQAAATLADEANGVSDNPLIFPEDDSALSGGNFHAEPVAFAADMLALAIVAENRQRAHPASVDSIPTSANQEDHVAMAAHGARRLGPMAKNAASIIAIEALTAAQACDFHAPLVSSPALEAVRARIRESVPHLDEDRYFHPDLAAARQLVLEGALIAAAGATPLPGVMGAAP